MKLRHQIAGGLIVIGSLGAVGAGTAFAATANDRPDRPSKEYVCAHQDEVATRLQTRIDKLNAALTKLADRRSKAEAAGHERIVQRIDRVVERVNNRLAKATEHLGNLPDWIVENC